MDILKQSATSCFLSKSRFWEMFVWFVPPVHVRIFPRPTTLKPVETYYYSHVTYSLQLDEHYNMYGMYETMNCFELVIFHWSGWHQNTVKTTAWDHLFKVKMQHGMPAVDWGESIYPAWWTSKYHLAQHEKTWNMTYTYLHSLNLTGEPFNYRGCKKEEKT